MILTVNIGNTHITVGGYEQDTLIFCGRLHSDPAATVEEYAIRLVNLLQLYGASPAQIEGGILGSVVPMLSGRVLAALQLLCKARILTVGPHGLCDIRQYRIILSADTASEVRQMLSQKHR